MARRERTYAGALKRLRVDYGLSQRELAGAIGVSQPLVARTEAGARRPEGPEEIAAVARALALDEHDHDQLLLLAGYWPSAFMALGPDDPTLGAVARALTDQALVPAVRDGVRRAIDGVLSVLAAALEAGAGAPAESADEADAAPSTRRPVGRRRTAGGRGS
jgi:transcriptional regulator with XRE-family HTH domain